MVRFPVWIMVLLLVGSGGLLPGTATALQVSPELRDAGSFFEAILANGMALRSGDVLVRTRENFDSVNGLSGVNKDGILQDRVTFTRVVFDFETSRHAVYSQREFRSLELEAGIPREDPGPGREGLWSDQEVFGACTNGPESPVYRRHFPLKTETRGRSEFPPEEPAFLDQVGFLDFRLFPLNPLARPGFTPSCESLLRRYATGDVLLSAEATDDGCIDVLVAFSSNNRFPPPEEGAELLDAGSVWRFRLDSLSPISEKSRIRFRRIDGSVLEAYTSSGREGVQMEWQLINDVQVPVSRTSSGIDTRIDSRGLSHTARSRQQIDFHWFSVNQPVEEKYFDGSLLRELADLRAVIDPKLCGAGSLIPAPPPPSEPAQSASDSGHRPDR